MAITYFGSAASPADGAGATQAGPGPLAVTPPASMVAGDLVVIEAQYRGTVTLTVSETGGQTWNSLTNYQGGTTPTLSHRTFWCRYNGTWSAAPSVTNTTGTLALSAVMHVFRPTTGSNLWAVDSAQHQGQWDSGDGATGIGASEPAITTTNASTVAVTSWASDDDNTWGNLAGSGWSVLGSAQYRNTQGNDMSSSYAYAIQTSPGTLSVPTQDQLTLGADWTALKGIAFYEYASQLQAPRSAHLFRQMMKGN